MTLVQEWDAEVEVDAELALRLIRGQFPELAAQTLRLFAEGWDNAVWLVDDEWAFRFPRRAIALPGVGHELAVLPVLAPLLPVAIPVPEFVGEPAEGYPWAFFGSRLIRGREAAGELLDDGAPTRLARFLGALHGDETRVAVAARHELPRDPNRRADMAFRVGRAVERLDEVERLGLADLPPSIDAILEPARELPAPDGDVVAHGDLHFRHLLVDERGGLTGVIDWGDVCRADPSIDLQVAWSLFTPEPRRAFLAAYGPVTEEQLLRARVLALFLSAVLAVYGHREGLAAVEREALAGLARAAAE
jgi:aminoglycoside phosphotransferase (APT) family kinase protein